MTLFTIVVCSFLWGAWCALELHRWLRRDEDADRRRAGRSDGGSEN
jgi:hypothetical protein